MEAQVFSLFTTPMLVVHELLSSSIAIEAIIRLILDEQKRLPTEVRSNRNGWESAVGLESWIDPAIAELKRHIHNMVVNLTVGGLQVRPSEIELVIGDSALANVGGRGAYHVPHIHRNSSWSAVYYVDVPEDDTDSGGELELLDPRMNAIIPGVHQRKQSFRIKPKTDMAICFPSWLEHWVHPWNSDKPRISIAWNCTILEVRKRQHPKIGE